MDTRNPTLVEKILGFLYTGNYTVKDNTAEVQIPPSDSDIVPESDIRNLEEALRVSQTDQDAIDNLPAEENIVGETTASLMDHFTINKRTAVAGEAPLTGTSKQIEAIDESLAECHPCYFHLRIYREANYFRIEGLKIKAEENFRDSFENCTEKEILAPTIKELYLTRANYRDIRKLATKLPVGNLRELQGGSTPGINSDLSKTFSEFATEFCLATMERYLSGPSSPEQFVPSSRVVYKPFEYKPSEYQWKK